MRWVLVRRGRPLNDLEGAGAALRSLRSVEEEIHAAILLWVRGFARVFLDELWSEEVDRVCGPRWSPRNRTRANPGGCQTGRRTRLAVFRRSPRVDPGRCHDGSHACALLRGCVPGPTDRTGGESPSRGDLEAPSRDSSGARGGRQEAAGRNRAASALRGPGDARNPCATCAELPTLRS